MKNNNGTILKENSGTTNIIYFVGNNNNFIHSGDIHGANNGNNSGISILVAAPTPKYSYMIEFYDNLTYSNRAKVLSLIEKLLKEQENQK